MWITLSDKAYSKISHLMNKQGANLPPQAKRLRPLFLLRSFLQNPIPFHQQNLKAYGSTYRFGIKHKSSRWITTDPDVIMHILRNNAGNYEKPASASEILGPIIGNGILIASGAEHASKRRNIQHAFHRGLIAQMHAHIRAEVMACLGQFSEQPKIDVLESMRSCTFRVLARAIFGEAFTVAQSDLLGKQFIGIYATFSKMVQHPRLSRLYKWNGTLGKTIAASHALRNEVLEFIASRRAASKPSNEDLLSVLMHAPDADTGALMSDQELAEECLTFFVAGHETCSDTLTWLIYVLSKHPEMIEKLRAEIQVNPEALSDYGVAMRLPYLNQVINECLRLYPPSWITDRIAKEQDSVQGYDVEPGTRIILYLYGLHQNEKFWKNPERFDPDRFQESEMKEQHTYAFLPFGAGPRMCIGRNLALMFLQTFVLELYGNFDTQVFTHQVGMSPRVTLQPDRVVWASLKKRW
jgi:cytochrome P450